MKKEILFLVCFLILFITVPSHAVVIEDFVGLWQGIGDFTNFDNPSDSFADADTTVELFLNGSILEGSFFAQDPTDVNGLVGIGFTGNVYNFNVPNPSPSEPDFALWNVTASAPEPTSLLLLGSSGLIGLVGLRRKLT